mmetsp:Transcript_17745/g.33758  ORF Transcript_17745/g.33758 Transcript_17745/m.33758 type:complete len:183 (-) Transcript_17745:296-844(-)
MHATLLIVCSLANLAPTEGRWAQDRLVIGVESDIATMKMMADRAAASGSSVVAAAVVEEENANDTTRNSSGNASTSTSTSASAAAMRRRLDNLPDDPEMSYQKDAEKDRRQHKPDLSEYIMLLQSIFLLCVFPILGLILIHGMYSEDDTDEHQAGQHIASQSQDIDAPSLVENKVLGGSEGR